MNLCSNCNRYTLDIRHDDVYESQKSDYEWNAFTVVRIIIVNNYLQLELFTVHYVWM